MNFPTSNEVAGSCRSFCRELATVTGLRIYFLPNALQDQEAHLPNAPPLGCPLLGDSGQGCEDCCRFLRSLLTDLESKPDHDFVKKICPGELQLVALRLPSSSNRDVLLAGQVLHALPSPNAVHRFSRKMRHRNRAEIDFEYLSYRYASVPQIRPQLFDHLILLLNSFIHLLSQLPSQQLTGNAPDEMSECVKRSLELLHLGYCDHLTPGEVAAQAGVTPRHLTRTFKRETGQTVGQYLAHLRVAHMADLLRHSHASVSEAAFASGFQSISAACRAFHKIMGAPPTLYLRNPGRNENPIENVYWGVE